jgi:hypothetical protein
MFSFVVVVFKVYSSVYFVRVSWPSSLVSGVLFITLGRWFECSLVEWSPPLGASLAVHVRGGHLTR